MRSALVASLLCISGIASAQAVHSGMTHLVASAVEPAFAFQASAIKANMPRIYSLIAPARLTEVKLAPSSLPTPNGEVVVEYTVNTDGVPENVHVVKPLEQAADQRVVDAVRRVRYTPGQLDGQAISMPVTLHVALKQ